MADKLLAEWFWVDRWMGSSAFLLPMEARGIYREMLSQAWRRGAQLPADHEMIQRAIGCSREEWERNWNRLSRYWTVTGDVMVNQTQVDVYRECQDLHEKRRAAGSLGGKKRASNLQANDQANDQAKSNPPDPDLDLSLNPKKKPSAAKNGGFVAQGFDEFWILYPRKVDKDDARKAWNKLSPDEALREKIAGAVRAQMRTPQWTKDNGEYIPHASRWLNGKRWNDELPPEKKSSSKQWTHESGWVG